MHASERVPHDYTLYSTAVLAVHERSTAARINNANKDRDQDQDREIDRESIMLMVNILVYLFCHLAA
jgi:1,4-dihydroxy-2-naphthoate octaprenyltransferase